VFHLHRVPFGALSCLLHQLAEAWTVLVGVEEGIVVASGRVNGNCLQVARKWITLTEKKGKKERKSESECVRLCE
jgi:hypothetical protein